MERGTHSQRIEGRPPRPSIAGHLLSTGPNHLERTHYKPIHHCENMLFSSTRRLSPRTIGIFQPFEVSRSQALQASKYLMKSPPAQELPCQTHLSTQTPVTHLPTCHLPLIWPPATCHLNKPTFPPVTQTTATHLATNPNACLPGHLMEN